MTDQTQQDTQGKVATRHRRSSGHTREPLSAQTTEPQEGYGMRTTMYRELGAHPGEHDGAIGTRFAVWAPNAREVSVITSGNGWNHGSDALNPSDSGVWSGFIAGLGSGEAYKYSIRTDSGQIIDKSDPYAFQSEFRPQTASVVCDLSSYQWNDSDWLTRRDTVDWLEKPVSIYEVHLGSWRRPSDDRDFFSYRELADQLIEYCEQLGYTHLQLMPVSEHPFDGSWGYQVTGYFAPTSRFGTPQDFMEFVDRCHQAGIGVLVDWVPAHFPTDPHGLGGFDGTALYEHEDPRRGFHPDWNTLIFNYGRNEVREFLLSSARFWCETYHIDGIRVDAVASMLYLDYSRESGEWVPNQHGGRENLDAISLLQAMNTVLHREFPGILTVAEESTAWPGVSRPVYVGGLGFTMKWDMGWMNDTLRYMRRDPIHRSHHQNELTFRAMYAFTENFVLPLSHDEVVHGKRSLISQMPGDDWQQFANLKLLFGYQFTTPGKKLMFMGGEIAQWTEWNHDAELDWALQKFPAHDSISRFIGDLNRLYRDLPALHELDSNENGFQWIQCDDWEQSTLAFVRWSRNKQDCVVVAMNFTPVPREGYRIGAPGRGFYREIFNSDAAIYGGGNIGNNGGLYSEPVAMHGFDDSMDITVPPLGMVILQPVRSGENS